MANQEFRFYAVSPEAVFDPLRRRWRSSVVRWDARKIGPFDMWQMIIVLDSHDAIGWFEGWLERNGKRGELALEAKQVKPFVVEDTIVVRKRLPFWRWIAHRFRSPYEDAK